MNEGLLASIIVPIYNVEKYLDECVQSLVSQSYQNIEILLIDDGAKDKSGEIADKWAEKDERVKVIHQGNQGISGARNTGLRKARGEYLFFVDSDDCVKENYVEELVSAMEKENADISMSRFVGLWKDGTKLVTSMPNHSMCMSSTEYLQNLYTFSGSCSVVWNKGYRRCLFDDIQFDIGKKNEDARLMLLLMKKVKKIAYIPSGLYLYRQRKSSIMNGENKSLLLQSELEWIQMHLDYLAEVNETKLYFTALKLYFNRNVEYYLYLDKVGKKAARKRLRKVGKQLVNKRDFSMGVRCKILFCIFFPQIYARYKNGGAEKRMDAYFD
ncbi:MAG: glycosyltransferase family 2 protein [Lachnospiraceae bacterium]|nr:glycosyltransferase family 2 protein [Lachnospiraceae bacterium]